MERFYGFMGWHDYARGGQLTNWGVHLMDIVQWGIGQDRPLSVQSVGGAYRGGAGADNYENIEAIYEFPGCTVTWEQRPQNRHGGKDYGVSFQGTDGSLFVDRATFKVEPAELGVAEFVGEPVSSWSNKDHINNFFDCMASRELPAADIEQGFRSTATVLLAESHLCVHTWPEQAGVTVDVYVCNLGADHSGKANALMDALIAVFSPGHVVRQSLQRGRPFGE